MYRILYFLDYGKKFGGAVNTLLNQAILMRNAGNDVKVFVSVYYGEKIEEEYLEICKKNNILLERAIYHLSSQPEDVDVVCLTKYYEDLKQKIQQYAPDILHSVQINPMVELISRECNIPHIMNVYPLLPEFFDIKYPNIFPYYHICDSEYWAKKWNYYLKTDYVCIRTSVSTESRERKKEHNDELIRFICVGDIYEEKNQLNVIKAFEIALRNEINAELHIYGHDDTEYASECHRYIIANELQQFVKIKGFKSNLCDLYKNYDALICGSTRESYPNAISEALFNDLVVITTPVGGVPEVIRDGQNGYICKGYSAKEIGEKVVKYIEDFYANRVDDILREARKTFKIVHSPSAVSEKLIEFYNHAIADNKHSSTISVQDIREQFKEEVEAYNKVENQLKDPLKVATKLWYLHFVKINIESCILKNSDFYIWGMGKMSTAVNDIVKFFFPQICIKGYLDSKKSGILNGIPIYKPMNIVKDENSVVFIAAKNGQTDMMKMLNESGKVLNKDYFILSERRW